MADVRQLHDSFGARPFDQRFHAGEDHAGQDRGWHDVDTALTPVRLLMTIGLREVRQGSCRQFGLTSSA
jgi:hypothetical protein